MFPYTLDYKSKQDCPIEPCPHCSWPGVWEQPMIDLEDEWIGSNPSCPECGNACSMLDACVMSVAGLVPSRCYSCPMLQHGRGHGRARVPDAEEEL